MAAVAGQVLYWLRVTLQWPGDDKWDHRTYKFEHLAEALNTIAEYKLRFGRFDLTITLTREETISHEVQTA